MQRPATMASLIVPGASQPGVQHFSRALPQGVVRSTLVNRAYAPLTNQPTERSGPFTPGLVCSCGQANPDSCVRSLAGTLPFDDTPLSRQILHTNLMASPYEPLSISPVQTYLLLRASPLAT